MMSSSVGANQIEAPLMRSDVWEKVSLWHCSDSPPPADEQVSSSLVSTEITINKGVCHLIQPLNGVGGQRSGVMGDGDIRIKIRVICGDIRVYTLSS